MKDFLCEYHFLKNVGERLLEQQHRLLTRTMTNQKIRSRLRSLRKDMVKASKVKATISDEAFQQLMDNPGNIEQFDLVQLRRRLAHLLIKMDRGLQSRS